MSLSDIPNVISILRILMVYPVVVYLYNNRPEIALAIFVIASISDLIDGYLARRFQWTSKLGGWLDPIADKLLINALYITLYIMAEVPGWLLVCILGRDFVIVLGVIYYYFKVEKLTATPTLISKINTFVQLGLVFLILVGLTLSVYHLPTIPAYLLQGGMWLVLALTLASGAGYVWIGIRRMMIVRNKGAV